MKSFLVYSLNKLKFKVLKKKQKLKTQSVFNCIIVFKYNKTYVELKHQVSQCTRPGLNSKILIEMLFISNENRKFRL